MDNPPNGFRLEDSGQDLLSDLLPEAGPLRGQAARNLSAPAAPAESLNLPIICRSLEACAARPAVDWVAPSTMVTFFVVTSSSPSSA